MLVGLLDGIEVVATAEDGRQALEHAQTHRPDVVMMDLHMPQMDGVEATRRICTELPRRPGSGPHHLRRRHRPVPSPASRSPRLPHQGRHRGRDPRRHPRRRRRTDPPRPRHPTTPDHRGPQPDHRPPTRPHTASMGAAGRTDPTRSRSPHPHRSRAIEQPDRPHARRQRGHRQDPHQPHPRQNRSTRPRPSRPLRLPPRPHPTHKRRQPTLTRKRVSPQSGRLRYRALQAKGARCQ